MQVFFCKEVIIKMLKILKMSQNLKKKLIDIKKKIASKNRLRRNLNKNKLTKLNMNIKLF